MNNELIIVALYLNLQGQSRQRADQHIWEIKKYIEEIFDDVYQTVKVIVIPTQGQDTKIECIYPSNNNPSTHESVICNIYEELLKSKYDSVSMSNINTVIRKVKIKKLLKRSS